MGAPFRQLLALYMFAELQHKEEEGFNDKPPEMRVAQCPFIFLDLPS